MEIVFIRTNQHATNTTTTTNFETKKKRILRTNYYMLQQYIYIHRGVILKNLYNNAFFLSNHELRI